METTRYRDNYFAFVKALAASENQPKHNSDIQEQALIFTKIGTPLEQQIVAHMALANLFLASKQPETSLRHFEKADRLATLSLSTELRILVCVQAGYACTIFANSSHTRETHTRRNDLGMVGIEYYHRWLSYLHEPIRKMKAYQNINVLRELIGEESSLVSECNGFLEYVSELDISTRLKHKESIGISVGNCKNTLGLEAINLGQYSAAIEYFRDALQYGGDTKSTRQNLVVCLVRTNRCSEAKEIADTMSSQDAEDYAIEGMASSGERKRHLYSKAVGVELRSLEPKVYEQLANLCNATAILLTYEASDFSKCP